MEEKKITITAIQLCAKIGDKKNNFKKIQELISKVKNTDVIVFPEVWTCGWSCGDFRQSAEYIKDSETIEFLKELALLKNANIIGGSFIQKVDEKTFYNTCPVIDRKGNLKALYNKNHLYSYYGCNEGKYVKAGDEALIVSLDGINFGITICYDIRFPEIFREYRKFKADVFVNCAAWASTKPVQWEIMTKSRAIENQTFMVAVNQYGPINNIATNLGHSRIIDYNGNVLSEILSQEGIIQSELNLTQMYEFRRKCTILNDVKKCYRIKLA